MQPGVQPGAASASSGQTAVSLTVAELTPAMQTVSQPDVAAAIGAVENFSDVFPEFLLLRERARIRNLFVEPEWLNAYLTAFAPSCEPIVLTARQQGRLTGVLPLVRTFGLWHGMPSRLLHAPSNSHCHSFDMILEQGLAGRTAVSAIIRKLRAIDNWDVLELPRMDVAGSALHELISAAADEKLLTEQSSEISNVFIPIEPGIGHEKDAPWQREAAANLRKDLRRVVRVVIAHYGCAPRFETCTNPTLEQISQFYMLESAGWKGAEGSAISSMSQTQRFYLDIVRTFSKAGRLMMNFLYLGDEIAAGQLGVITDDSICGLKLAYDEHLSKYSPGNLLINELLRFCWHNGIRKLELGPDGIYKRRWSQHEVRLVSLAIFNRGFYGRLLHTYKFEARPRVKRALAWLRPQSTTRV
ncbi:MAG: GNAT family N-acetyltransferase [Candidatus Acidiferrales bacterium]